MCVCFYLNMENRDKASMIFQTTSHLIHLKMVKSLLIMSLLQTLYTVLTLCWVNVSILQLCRRAMVILWLFSIWTCFPLSSPYFVSIFVTCLQYHQHFRFSIQRHFSVWINKDSLVEALKCCFHAPCTPAHSAPVNHNCPRIECSLGKCFISSDQAQCLSVPPNLIVWSPLSTSVIQLQQLAYCEI